MTNQDYGKLVNERSKPSPMGKDMLWAFLVGGLICVIGQLLLDGYRHAGLGQEAAGTATSVTLIFVTALLTGIGLTALVSGLLQFIFFPNALLLVPITGFANAVVSPAMEFKQEGFVTGTSAKLFTVAGPVLVYGISASVIYGVILWLSRLG